MNWRMWALPAFPPRWRRAARRAPGIPVTVDAGPAVVPSVATTCRSINADALTEAVAAAAVVELPAPEPITEPIPAVHTEPAVQPEPAEAGATDPGADPDVVAKLDQVIRTERQFLAELASPGRGESPWDTATRVFGGERPGAR